LPLAGSPARPVPGRSPSRWGSPDRCPRGRPSVSTPADLPDRKTNDPDAVAAQSFTTVRKGYEPDEVRAFLLAVASTMRDAKLRYEDMERRLVEVERRAADPKDLDEHAVTQLLGEETARVLETA